MAKNCFRWVGVATMFCVLGTGHLLAYEESAAHKPVPRPNAEGQEKNGMRQGRWTFTWPDGRTASGHYKDDHRDGLWREILPDGRKLSGRYKKGLKHGVWVLKPLGTQAWMDPKRDLFDPAHSVAERLYLNGEASGPWRLYFRNIVGEGHTIDSKGRIQGHWKFRSTRGRRETSVWVNGIREGPVVISWADGTRENGDFRIGRRFGVWRLRWGDGSIEKGVYSGPEREGLWKIEYPDGHVERGQYGFGKRIGRWHIRWPDGARGTADYHVNGPTKWSIGRGRQIKGKFEYRSYNKKGLWAFNTCGNALYCKGKYSNDERVGLWIYRLADGTFVKAHYWRDLRKGPVETRHPDGSVTHSFAEDRHWHGFVTRRFPSGVTLRTRYIFGKIDGTNRAIWPSGHVEEQVYNNGQLISDWEPKVVQRRQPQ